MAIVVVVWGPLKSQIKFYEMFCVVYKKKQMAIMATKCSCLKGERESERVQVGHNFRVIYVMIGLFVPK